MCRTKPQQFLVMTLFGVFFFACFLHFLILEAMVLFFYFGLNQTFRRNQKHSEKSLSVKLMVPKKGDANPRISL